MAQDFLGLQNEVLENVGRGATGVAATTTDRAAAKRHLNRAYQYDIPLRVGGSNSRGFWFHETAASSDGSIQLDTQTAALLGPIHVDNLPAWTTTDWQDFWRRYDIETSSRGTPIAALIVGRIVYVRPLPSGTFTLYSPCIVFRPELVEDANVLTDPVEEAAVVARATVRMARTMRDRELVAEWAETFNDEVSQLQTQSAVGIATSSAFDADGNLALGEHW